MTALSTVTASCDWPSEGSLRVVIKPHFMSARSLRHQSITRFGTPAKVIRRQTEAAAEI
jgi:hypothetical protein